MSDTKTRCIKCDAEVMIARDQYGADVVLSTRPEKPFHVTMRSNGQRRASRLNDRLYVLHRCSDGARL